MKLNFNHINQRLQNFEIFNFGTTVNYVWTFSVYKSTAYCNVSQIFNLWDIFGTTPPAYAIIGGIDNHTTVSMQ